MRKPLLSLVSILCYFVAYNLLIGLSPITAILFSIATWMSAGTALNLNLKSVDAHGKTPGTARGTVWLLVIGSAGIAFLGGYASGSLEIDRSHLTAVVTAIVVTAGARFIPLRRID